MGRKRYTVESIVRMLREAEVELAGGSTVKQVSRKLLLGYNLVTVVVHEEGKDANRFGDRH